MSFFQFQLIDKLGAGASGITFKAKNLETNEICALKIIRKEVSRDEDAMERFHREISILQKIGKIPHFVKYLDHGVANFSNSEKRELPYFTMELIEGEKLSQVMEKKHFSIPETLSIISKIAEAVCELHREEVIHRDIKPDNIIISQQGEITLIDLGLALDLQTRNRLTQTGVVIGTPIYMAPEIFLGNKDINGKADIFSLGILLFQLLAQQASPFGDHLRTDPMAKVAWPEDLEITDNLKQLCEEMLCFFAEERPSAKEVLQKIQ